MKQTRQQKLDWVEIKQKRFRYANVQKTDSRGDNEAPRSKRLCLAKRIHKTCIRKAKLSMCIQDTLGTMKYIIVIISTPINNQ